MTTPATNGLRRHASSIDQVPLMFDLIALAWQTNRTNVASMRMVKEASMRVYKNLGISEAFHPTSHWGGFPERIANLRLIQNYHTGIFAKFVERDSTHAVLEDASGQKWTLPINDLAPDDQRMVESFPALATLPEQ